MPAFRFVGFMPLRSGEPFLYTLKAGPAGGTTHAGPAGWPTDTGAT